MAKRRRCRFSVRAKGKATEKGKTPTKPEKECEEKDGGSESLETDAKKRKLGVETSEKESASQTGKYVPPFTASQRVVKLSKRDKLCLNKTGLSSQENSPQFTDNTQEKVEETTNDERSKEGHEVSPENSEKNEEIITLKKEKDHGMDDSSVLDIPEVHLPPADVSVNCSKEKVESEKGKNTANESITVEDMPDLGNSSTPAVPEKNPVELKQIIDDKEIVIDDKINEAEKQEHDILNPADTETSTLSVEGPVNDTIKSIAEVPKLSELIKRSYANIGEDEKLENPTAIDDLTNYAPDLSSERAENVENAEHGESQREIVDTFNNENLTVSTSNTIYSENQHPKTEFNSRTENQTNGTTLVENDCERVTENAEVKKSTENSSTDLCKNDGEAPNEKSSVTISDDNEQTNEENDDQKVPDEMLEKSLTPNSEMVVTDKMQGLSPIPKEATESCLLDESKCENPNDVGVSTTVSTATGDDLSFAKEFEALEELFPIDDMGLLDDVTDDQLKSVSVEEEMPQGDSTIELLINEIASLNCMVANYQKSGEEMRRHYKISFPY